MIFQSGPAEIHPRISPKIDDFLKSIPARDESLNTKTAGRERIFIELASDPKKAAFYAKKYNELVSDLVSVLKSEYPKISENRELFITELWGMLNSNRMMNFESQEVHLLSEALETGVFVCVNSAFLIYDVAAQLGIDANLVSAHRKDFVSHVLVAFSDYCFDIAEGICYERAELVSKYNWHNILKQNQTDCFALIDAGIYSGRSAQITSVFSNNSGKNKAGSEEFKKAISYFDQSIAINPDYPDAYYNRGITYANMNQFEKSIVDFTKAIQIDGKYYDAYNKRANTYSKMRQFEKAVADYTAMIVLAPNDPSLYTKRAACYRKLGKISEAKSDEKQNKKMISDSKRQVAVSSDDK